MRPDIIYLDGAEGGTGAGPHVASEETGIPLMAAIPEARRALEDVGLADEIDLVVAGGIRNGGDIAKCIALGAKAVAIGHSALMALNCNKEIPGVTDYEGTIGVPAASATTATPAAARWASPRRIPELRKRLNVEEAAHASTTSCTRSRSRCRCSRAPAARPTSTAWSPRTWPRSPPRRPRWRACRWPAPTTSRASPRVARSRRSRRCSTATWRTRSISRRSRSGWSSEREPQKIQSIDAEYLSGERFPYQEDIALVEDIDLQAATPGEDINWLEDIELLEEEGSPAVFDRYSNSFLKIYFPIPEGREDEIARKVLIAHLQSGNSYGIRLKETHCKFPSPSSGRGSRDSRTVGADWRPPVLEGWEPPPLTCAPLCTSS